MLRYVRFEDDSQVMALGRAQDEATILSRFTFYWVNPLIEKGIVGRLQKIDDLFELPESLNIFSITDKIKNVRNETKSLLKILRQLFGVEFFSIGILRFISDTAGFAGPLLLAALLKHETSNDTEFDFIPYLYASGLFAVTLISIFLYFIIKIFLLKLKKKFQVLFVVHISIGECH